MLRRTSGSSLCYRCGRLNRVDADRCFYCGAPRPGLWGWGHALGRIGVQLDTTRLVIGACMAAYVASLVLDPQAMMRGRGPFSFFAPSHRPNHALFDLTGYITERVHRNGVESFEDIGFCTYADPERFFSYRRTTHNGEPDYGRHINAIAIAQ